MYSTFKYLTDLILEWNKRTISTAATSKARSEDNKSKDILENRKNKTKRSDGGRKNYINELFNCLWAAELETNERRNGGDFHQTTNPEQFKKRDKPVRWRNRIAILISLTSRSSAVQWRCMFGEIDTPLSLSPSSVAILIRRFRKLQEILKIKANKSPQNIGGWSILKVFPQLKISLPLKLNLKNSKL